MTFDQTMLLIFSQICIQTNLEFDIIKKPQSVQQYLYYIPMMSILASTTLRNFTNCVCIYYLHLPTFWVHKWWVKYHHGLQWSASNYFSPAQLKTSPKNAKK